MNTTDQASEPGMGSVPESSGRIDLSTLAALAAPGLLQPSLEVTVSSPDGSSPFEQTSSAVTRAPSGPKTMLFASSVICGLGLLAVGGATGHAVALGWTARPALASAGAGSETFATSAAIDGAGPAGIGGSAAEAGPDVSAERATDGVAIPPLGGAPSARGALPTDPGNVVPGPVATGTVEPGRHEVDSASRLDPAVGAADASRPSRSSHRATPAPPAWLVAADATDVAPPSATAGTAGRSERATLDELLLRAGYSTRLGSHASTSTASTPLDGPTSEQARAAFAALAPALRACAAGAHSSGRITLVVAGETGRVRSANVTGDFAGTPAGSCMARAARGVRFEAFSRETFSIAYPFAM